MVASMWSVDREFCVVGYFIEYMSRLAVCCVRSRWVGTDGTRLVTCATFS